jgi:hypothetical protein
MMIECKGTDDRRRHPDGETSYDIGIQLSEKVCTGEGMSPIEAESETDM